MSVGVRFAVVKQKLKEPRNAVERNLALTGEVTRYLLNHPKVFDFLPDSFHLVILPDDDPEMCSFNLALMNSFDDGSEPVVLARLKSNRASDSASEQTPPSFYVPLRLEASEVKL